MSKLMKFENVLDECLDRMLLKGESLEQCLNSYPEHADRLKPLLETALVTHQVSAIQPDAAFRTKARYQFQAALRQHALKTAPKPNRFSFNLGWQPRWVVATASLLIISMLGGTSVAAARSSMPDSPLYPVKLATEKVQMVLTFSNIGKAELNATLADKRVEEIVYLSDKNEPEKLAQTTNSLSAHLNELSAHVSSPGVAVVGVTGIQEVPPIAAPTATLPEPAPVPEPEAVKKAPGIAEPPATDNASELNQGNRLATTAAISPSAAAVITSEKTVDNDTKKENSEENRRAKLKTDVENQADNNIARLKASVESAPESAKPALKRALNISEDEYKKAIEALKKKND